jgi:hypothetical protein
MHKKERISSYALWIALPQADTIAQRKNAPKQAHLHLHAVCILEE